MSRCRLPGRSDTATAYLAFGGNLGDVAGAMGSALRHLDAHPEIAVVKASPLYRTPAWGVTNQPDFLNAVAEISTTLAPHDLLDVIQAAETRHGRVRERRWGPRTLDIDILFHAGGAVATDRLKIPHPGIGARAFVLVPMRDLVGDRLPDGRSISELMAVLETGEIRPATPDSGWWRRSVD